MLRPIPARRAPSLRKDTLPTMIRSMTSIRERIGWLDAGIAVLAVGLATAYMSVQPSDDALPDASWWAVPFFALIAVPLLWRRVSPLAAAES